MASKMYAETELEKQSLAFTTVLSWLWSTAIKTKVREDIVSDLEGLIIHEAKKEWGEETIIDFDRSDRLVAVEHPFHGLRGLGASIRL